MNNIYYLKSCSTCTKIIKSLDLPASFVLQDIKTTPLDQNTLEKLHKLSGSYEALFSKRAQLYKEKGLKNQTLNESDYKHYILEHYTFLSRPVIVYNDQIFIGNSAKTVAAAKATIHS